jgi:hypothetical protein
MGILSHPSNFDMSEGYELHAALDAEGSGFYEEAATAYAVTINLIGEAAEHDPSAQAERLICYFGIMRCTSKYKTYEPLVNEELEDMLGDEEKNRALQKSADRLIHPIVQSFYGGRGETGQLRYLNYIKLRDPISRFDASAWPEKRRET